MGESWSLTLADDILAGGRPRLPRPQQDEDGVLGQGLEVLAVLHLVAGGGQCWQWRSRWRPVVAVEEARWRSVLAVEEARWPGEARPGGQVGLTWVPSLSSTTRTGSETPTHSFSRPGGLVVRIHSLDHRRQATGHTDGPLHYGLTGRWVQKVKASYLAYFLQCALTDYASGKA